MSQRNFKPILILMAFLFLSIAASAQGYGSKVMPADPDEAKALSPFYAGPEFAFIDLSNNGVFEPADPVYLNINPADGVVSENDVRITPFDTFPAGTQVSAADPDHDKALIRFGTYRYPAAELRYFDTNGDKSYSLNDPVYLDFNPGEVSAGDVRITGYPGFSPSIGLEPGTRVSDADPDSGKPTATLPGVFGFYNTYGNINNGGWAVYDGGDIIYLDTQYPFNVVSINDIRLSI
jgi:hypothetical protein